MMEVTEKDYRIVCAGCSGKRNSGSYFNNKCKYTPPDCQRIKDFTEGWDKAVKKIGDR